MDDRNNIFKVRVQKSLSMAQLIDLIEIQIEIQQL